MLRLWVALCAFSVVQPDQGTVFSAQSEIQRGAADFAADFVTDDRVIAAIESAQRPKDDKRFDQRRRPDLVLSLLGVSPGMTVLDVFGGAGFYTELLSHLVGQKGKVIYHSNTVYDRRLAVALRKRFAAARLANVDRQSAELNDLQIAPNSLDRALLILTYHDFYFESSNWPGIDEHAVLARLHKGLKPGGRVVVVDHQALDGTGGNEAGRLHRIEKALVKADFSAAGFLLVEESDALANPDDSRMLSVFDPAIRGRTDRFVMVFEKRGSDSTKN